MTASEKAETVEVVPAANGNLTTPSAEHLRFPEPPPPKTPYSHDVALEDLPAISYALQLFLASHMVESEEYCHDNDPKKERLYFASGYGLIQCFKGLMSFEDEDLVAALNHAKHGNAVANQHRKRGHGLAGRLAGLVVSSYSQSGVAWYKSMTPVERHAELVYAESLFEKALLGIVYSGDWLAFIKEALNMRTTINIYQSLGQYVEAADADARERGLPEDPTIDAHFRSGVYLGVGMSSLILSLMPAKLLTIVELFGYKGDRKSGLDLLMRAGGWSKERKEPTVGIEQEGVRRTICDAALLVFHLVLSAFTFDGVDIDMAQKVLDWNLERYPNGVLFLFGAGRLALCRSQPRLAIENYQRAMRAQSQYENLHQISHWECAIANMALCEVAESLACWKELMEKSTWSKAVYTYGVAICLVEIGGEGDHREATELLEKVPSLRQRIAGKSIPLEKFVDRKARKFKSQNGRLALPVLEFAYLFLGIAHTSRVIITSKMLPQVNDQLAKLKACENDAKKYEGGKGYWDDLVLAKFLKGVCYRFLAYPDPDAVLDPSEKVDLSNEEAAQEAITAFESVLADGPKIEFDHYLVYYTHYEMGRLLACKGDKAAARRHFDAVLSGKHLEVNPASRKQGKYSLESALHVRTHAASDALDKRDRL